MLKQRILTALVLLPLMLGMLFFASAPVWAVFTGIIALLGLWEYGRLCQLSKPQHICYLTISFIFGLWLYLFGFTVVPDQLIYKPGFYLLILLMFLAVVVPVFWFLIVPLWLKNKWKLHPNLLGMAVGWLLILPFWLALVEFGPGPFYTTVPVAKRLDLVSQLLIMMSIVWIADISAYFIGRAIGKHKLAPVISPNKSWEGAIGAMVCTSLYIGILSFVLKQPWLYGMVFAMLTLILTIVSILGDLLESWLKRAVGMKDSSALLPGHGGILDRIDSLLAVLGVGLALYCIMLALIPYISGLQ
ncbi:phosphatidate cytidylyltransferase [Neisseriaceae bacterium ESL0693]|nr:phosphatidate cytidylyltransferase [Neisseriaceae bacterium ESL0693]